MNAVVSDAVLVALATDESQWRGRWLGSRLLAMAKQRSERARRGLSQLGHSESHGGLRKTAASTASIFGYRVGPKASAIRASSSFFTSFFGSGLSTGKWSEPLVFVYPSVSLASCEITEPLCGT
jgi:hypothetical protein